MLVGVAVNSKITDGRISNMNGIKWKSCFKIGVTALLVFLCIYYWKAGTNFVMAVMEALSPLFLGAVTAYTVNILMTYFERHYFKNSTKKAVNKSRRPVCMITAFLLLFLIVFMVIGLVLPEVVKSVVILVNNLPDTLERLSENEIVAKYLPMISENLSKVDWEKLITEGIDFIRKNINGILGNLATTVSTVFSSLVTLVIGFVFSIYLLLGKDVLKVQGLELMQHYLKPDWSRKIKHLLSMLDRNFHNFIVGQCTEAVILGLLCAAGMFIFQFPYAVTIGALIGLTALIPVAGAYIGAAAGVFMMLTVSPMKAVLFVVFIVVLQQIEGNLIYPKVVGDSIGLPALWVLVAVTLGGGIGGVVGMLAAVPLMATAYQIVQNDVRKRRL